MEWMLIGGLAATMGLFLLINNCHDPLEEGFKQAQAWERNQKKLREVLGK